MKPADYYNTCLNALSQNLSSEWKYITKAYAGRAYHNLSHLEEMLGHLPGLLTSLGPATAHSPGEASPPEDEAKRNPRLSREAVPELGTAPIFGIALIYHDIVYRAGRKDNEARSADQAVRFLMKAGVGEAEQVRCRKLIMATKTHEAATEEEGVLVDLDLAVLARDPPSYNTYARNVRKEFSLFPNFLYRPGRKKALLHFLEKPYIYHGEVAREKWEAKARYNIEHELRSL